MTDSSIPDMMAAARRDKWTDQQLAAKAVELAESILKQSNAGMRRKEKKQAEQMERMMNDPAGKAFTLALADRVFRPSSPRSCSATCWTATVFPVICPPRTGSP